MSKIGEVICAIRESTYKKKEKEELVNYVENLRSFLLKEEEENKKLKNIIKYHRENGYIAQLEFERDMLQDLIDGDCFPNEERTIKELLDKNTKLSKNNFKKDKLLNDLADKLVDFMTKSVDNRKVSQTYLILLDIIHKSLKNIEEA